jgi:hypothetical protein
MEDNLIGSALAQEELSHYTPESNRCYVKLDVHTADLSKPREQYTQSSYLFDGQTHEMLASTSMKGEQKWAHIFSASLTKFAHDPAIPTYEEVDSMIDKFMAEDRKP